HQVRFIRRRNWTAKLKTWVRRYFRDEIAPIITPIGLDPTHPFPLLVNKSLNFIVELEGVDAFGRDSGLAIIPAPRLLPRIIRVPEDVGGPGDNYVFLSSMIHAHADDLFQGMKVKGCYQFRLTRNADLALDSEDVEDLARALRGELAAICAVHAGHSEAAAEQRKHLQRDQQAGHSAAAPFRVVHAGRGFAASGSERPSRAGRASDAVSQRCELGNRRCVGGRRA
nr:hypothetical protein [Tanacetum cinerariifolium]